MFDSPILITTLTFAAIALSAIISHICWKNGYKNGQIDAIGKDNIEWHLVDHNDGSKTWEEI